MPNDQTFIERDDNGKRIPRQYDTVPVKQKRRVYRASPRMTERAALDRAAYGDGAVEAETPDERETAIFRTGEFAYCVKCHARKPATPEYFRRDTSRRRGWRQPCHDCNRKLARTAMAHNRAKAAWRNTGKFRK